MNKMKGSSPLFAGDRKTIEIWNRMLRLQADLSFHTELPAYFLSANWRQAEKILDVGTGNGYYLQKINRFFPKKSYFATDNNPELISIARQEHNSDNTQYKCISFNDTSGQYDFIIMRLFLQHMPDIDAVLDHAALLVPSGASLLIIDIFDPPGLFDPVPHRVRGFFRAHRKASAARGLDPDVQGRIRTALKTSRHWQVKKESEIIVSSALPGNLDLFRQSYALFIDLAQHRMAVDCDFSAVRQEWQRWCGLENAYTQVGAIIVELSRDINQVMSRKTPPSRVSLSQSVMHFAFGQGIVLWEKHGGGIFVCNDTLLLLVPSLTKGTTLSELAAILAGAYGIETQRAVADCAALLEHLQNEGLLEGSRHKSTAKDANAVLELSDSDREISGFTTRINGKTIRISAGATVAEFLRPLFPDAQPGDGAADTEILCRPNGQGSLVTVDGVLHAETDDPGEAMGAILEQVIRAVHPAEEWLAFLHAGSVRRNGTAIVLPAPCGSGKSTLIGFLAANGFDYLSDDLVPLTAPHGKVAACPVSVNLKAGSRGLYPVPAGFETVTLHDRFRTDQLLLPPAWLWETPPSPLGAIVFPRYQPNVPTGFAPIAPLDGLARLFSDRIFLGYPLEETRIANFLRWAEETPFYSLEYSELTEAARCLATLTE